MHVSGCGKPGLANQVRNYIGRGLQLLLMFVGLSFIQNTVVVAMGTYAAGMLIASLILVAYADIPPTRPKMDKIRSLARFAKWSIPNTIANDFYQRFDTIILSIMVGSVAVGFYDSSVRLSTFGFAFASGIASASNVKISGLFEQGEDFIPVIEKTISTAALFVYPTLIISLIHAETILEIAFGASYIDARWFLVAIIAYQVQQAYRKQYEAIFNAFDEPNKITLASFTAVIVNVLTAPFLVLSIGGVGAVVSTIISEFARFGVYQYQLNRKLGRYVVPKEMYLQPAISVLILCLIWIRSSVVALDPTAALIADSLACLVLFFGTLIYISPPTLEFIRSLFVELKLSFLISESE